MLKVVKCLTIKGKSGDKLTKAYSRTHANRGAVLERLIDMTNTQYHNKGFASVIRQHPEVTVTAIKGNQITRGFYKKKGAPDYIGITANGKAVIFDAKETTSRTSFALSNIPDHQYELLKSWHEKGAQSFLLVSFAKLDEIYRLPFIYLEKYWEGAKKGERKSIPHPFFFMNCDIVKSEKGYVLHYLK